MNVLGLVEQYHTGDLSCGCCGKHTAGYKSAIHAGSVQKLPAFLMPDFPAGTTVALAYADDEPFMTVKRVLVRAGYTIYPVPIRYNTVAAVESVQLPDHARVIVAAGVPDAAKYLAAKTGRPVCLALTEPSVSAAVPAATLMLQTRRQYRTPAPRAVIADPELCADVKSGWGLLAAAVVAVFDGFTCNRLQRADFCPQSASAILKIAETAAVLPETLFEACGKISAIGCLAGDSRYAAGSVFTAAAALERLYTYEQRPGADFAGCLAALPPILLRMYAQRPRGFMPPPDNNMRMDAMVDLLGLQETVAAERLCPPMSARELGQAAYLLKLYSRDVAVLRRRCLKIVDKLFYRYRRACPDGGYALVRALDARDIELAFALTPDLSGKFTYLTYLKNLGMLDGYLSLVV